MSKRKRQAGRSDPPGATISHGGTIIKLYQAGRSIPDQPFRQPATSRFIRADNQQPLPGPGLVLSDPGLI